ncbi:VG15 protein [Streptomyces sp. NBC_01768]|uniref:VG15 protein n=1 Tax=Streptomyces sp. NBC_01768 TaxID=2975938 RepID=UPI002DD9AD2E|nr:hypothetical protein [Streptomyces sp. NBC_01768]WSC31782.1 hypothetical protein OG902_36615 [Streptomyces sp. NBC_01768]
MRRLDEEGTTERYRQGQVRIGARLAARVLSSWRRTIRPTDLDASSAEWLDDVMPAVREERGRSRRLSGAYVRIIRALSIGSTLPPLDADGDGLSSTTLGDLADDFADELGERRERFSNSSVRVAIDGDDEWPGEDSESADRRATVSLMVNGPVRVRRNADALRGRLDDVDVLDELSRITTDAGESAAGAGDREALMGGRDLIHGLAETDSRIIGWARVPDDDPCWMCSMLASRGAVYRTRGTASTRGTGRRRMDADDPEQYHTNCQCVPIPIYSRTDWIPPESQQYQADWLRVTRGLGGAEARAAWRQYINARRRERRANS